MKVLEPGRDQRGWSIEAKCTGGGNGGGGCGAKLLVEESDLYLTHSHYRDGSTSYVTFCCVACDVETDLGDGRVPDAVRRRLIPKWNERMKGAPR